MIEMLNEDCMDVMACYPDNHFDLAIVDPPYGKKPTRNTDGLGVCRKTFESGSDKWDNKPNTEYWDELFRVTVNQIVWGANYFLEHLTETNSFIVWDKVKTFGAFADCELAWTSHNSVSRIFKYTWNGMLQQNMKNKEKRIHPTQKPVALYKWILQNYAKPNDKILDTHGGSGSICIACYDEGFDLTWTELDKDYYDAAVKRFNNHKAQGQLFKPEPKTVTQTELY